MHSHRSDRGSYRLCATLIVFERYGEEVGWFWRGAALFFLLSRDVMRDSFYGIMRYVRRRKGKVAKEGAYIGVMTVCALLGIYVLRWDLFRVLVYMHYW